MTRGCPQSKNYRYSTDHQVVIDADSRLVVSVGRPVPGNRNDCKAWELSGAKSSAGNTTVIADGGYRGTGLIIPHRREPGQTELPAWKESRNTRAGGQCTTCQEQEYLLHLAETLPVQEAEDDTCPGHNGPCGRPVVIAGMCGQCRFASQADRDRVKREWEWEAAAAAAVAAAQTEEARQAAPAPF